MENIPAQAEQDSNKGLSTGTKVLLGILGLIAIICVIAVVTLTVAVIGSPRARFPV